MEAPPPPPSEAPPPPPDSGPPPPPSFDNAPSPSLGPTLAAKNKQGWAPAKLKSQPLSIEEILAKKKAADEAAAKVMPLHLRLHICAVLFMFSSTIHSYTDLSFSVQPKFLTKAQREKLAFEKREKETAELKKKKTEPSEKLVPAPVDRYANGSNGTNGASRTGNTGNQRSVQDGRSAIPTGPRSQRGPPAGPAAWRNNQHNRGQDMQPPPPPKPATLVNGSKGEKRPNPENPEAALIRQRYMGADQNQSNFSAKKKRKRTTEKKFNFEWNAEEDTSIDHNPMYKNRNDPIFFGRGKLGGFANGDDSSKTNEYAKVLERLDPTDAGRQRAEQMREMEKRAQEAAGRNGIDKHWSEKKLEHMRERDWRIFKEDFNIATKGGSIPNPMRSWKESNLPRKLLDIVHQVGYTEPSAVQRAAIPVALQSRDLIGVAVTGSGKTAAFLLPLLVYISELPALNEMTKNDGPYAIILAPTRELAQQIELEAKKFATPLGFTCVSIVGGHSIEEQAYNLRDGAEIIIATPGRLVDCIERRVLVLSQCCYIIMDEADRMIDLGFEEPVNKILDALPVGNEKPDTEDAENALAMSRHLGDKDRYRQTMMYTATMPAAVERIARKYLRRPAIVTIGNVGEAVETVEQRIEFVSGEDKRKKRLNEILNSHEFAPPIIVFVNIKRNCDAISRDIQRMGFSSVTLHGSKTQDQREAALASLRNGQTQVLVATDLAGRGIDVPDVSLVVNFNMAHSIEAYTHRVGRTGRAGKSGVAITFLGNEDSETMYVQNLFLVCSRPCTDISSAGTISSRCSPRAPYHAFRRNCASMRQRSRRTRRAQQRKSRRAVDSVAEAAGAHLSRTVPISLCLGAIRSVLERVSDWLMCVCKAMRLAMDVSLRGERTALSINAREYHSVLVLDRYHGLPSRRYPFAQWLLSMHIWLY